MSVDRQCAVTGEKSGDGILQYIQSAVEHAEAGWNDHNCDHLVISGLGETLSVLREELTEPLRAHLVGEIYLSPLADIQEILTQVQQIERDLDRRIDAQRIEELVTGSENGRSY